MIVPTGNARKCTGDDLIDTIGRFLVAMLLAARDSGAFKELLKTKGNELGVDDLCSGAFGWSIYKKRGKENLA